MNARTKVSMEISHIDPAVSSDFDQVSIEKQRNILSPTNKDAFEGLKAIQSPSYELESYYEESFERQKRNVDRHGVRVISEPDENELEDSSSFIPGDTPENRVRQTTGSGVNRNSKVRASASKVRASVSPNKAGKAIHGDFLDI